MRSVIRKHRNRRDYVREIEEELVVKDIFFLPLDGPKTIPDTEPWNPEWCMPDNGENDEVDLDADGKSEK